MTNYNLIIHNSRSLMFKGKKMQQKIHILLSEDTKMYQELFLGILEELGIKVDIATNGQEAIKKSKEKRYTLILMDIDMPIMNGYEATKRIRAENKSIPIIALSTHNSVEAKIKTKAVGMNEHLCKPIFPATLYNTILNYA